MQSSDKDQAKNNKYITFPVCSQKILNHPINLCKRIISLKHIVYILKLLNQIMTNFVLKFSNRGGWKTKKKYFY